MGVPKFFRWMSERYPAISQLISGNRIPEFDCLYLDMNGIIHNCTHKDSDSPTFRMTEAEMITNIFKYIDHLYDKIRPKKLFFMAIDGVAPRAKMNQQRARRFRTALDAEVAKDKAIKQGHEMPKEDPFDSNCITPGTEFMARLSHHLQYFIHMKVTEDRNWQDIDIVLSGHEVPGEGEHKIMEYIRLARSQPGYDPNVRHCLYGLDADLIMLGLLSHDPHFCLLREEVNFGRAIKKKTTDLEHQNFYLMHLCIVREYLELEFQDLKGEGVLSFPFDMERVIDDFILLCYFVGNDFLPHLPHLHIREGALTWMFGIYKDTLPKIGGYINDNGTINLGRLGKLLDHLGDLEYRFFEAESSDLRLENIQSETTREDPRYQELFRKWKHQYYLERFGWGLDNVKELKALTENYVQGLQWVLFYYYRGVVSWPWFFKYHYAPMISDVNVGLGVNMKFDLGQPFLPFQQLMGVLPDRSQQIIPEAYRYLMSSSDSPIIDLYPRDFELDMNGKKAPWEAVVKIPFVDEGRLLSAMKKRDHLLTKEEKERNTFNVSSKFTHSPAIDYIYPSSLPSVFPNLSHCHCLQNDFDLPTMDGLEPAIGLIEGAKLGINALAGFPSLKTVPHYGQLGYHSVNVFQQDSPNESMVITLLESEKRSAVSRGKKKLGKSVYVGFPFLHEAKVVRVVTEHCSFAWDETQRRVVEIPHTAVEANEFIRKSSRIENIYSKRLGMIIGEVETLVQVKPLKGLIKKDSGASVKEFGDVPGVETDYALQVVIDNVVSEDERFIERAALSVEKEFPPNSKAFFLGESDYGVPVVVHGHSRGTVNGKIYASRLWKSEFGRQVVRETDSNDPYSPSSVIADDLRLNRLALSKLTSSFDVFNGSQKLNLGLNLKFEAKKQKVLGYSRRSNHGWEFSRRARDLIKEYIDKFPEFVAGIQRFPQGDKFRATDFYPEDVASSKITEIQNWLKSVRTKEFERVPLEAEQLDSDQVKAIEQRADQYVTAVGSSQPKFNSMRFIPRNALLKPEDAERRLGHQSFRLGDRALYAEDTGHVPLGMKGTIVGMTRTARVLLLDVLFDECFLTGTTLGDRCSPFRGHTVPSHSMLNLSYPQLGPGNVKNRQQNQHHLPGSHQHHHYHHHQHQHHQHQHQHQHYQVQGQQHFPRQPPNRPNNLPYRGKATPKKSYAGAASASSSI